MKCDRRILKCDYIRYSPPETSTKKTLNSQIDINISREDSVTSFLNGYLDLNFEVIKNVDNSRLGNGNDTRLVNLGPIALFSSFKLTTSSGKRLEDISHVHSVSLFQKLITSSRASDDLSMRFDRSRNRRRDKLAQNKNLKGKYHVKFMLKDILGFAEHQDKASYSLGYKLTLTRYKDDAVIDKTADISDARFKIDHIHWYLLHYTPSIQQQGILFKQILSKTPTELRYIELSVFLKEVNNRNLWKFELSSQENMSVSIWNILDFQQRAFQNSQSFNIDTFCRLPVTSAQCIIGTEKYPDGGVLLKNDDDDYALGCAQIKEAFRVLTKDDILQPYTSDDEFRSSNVRADDFGFKLYVFDIRYQRNFTVSQPIKVEFKFDGVVPYDINGYALVSTNKLVSRSSEGQRLFDLI